LFEETKLNQQKIHRLERRCLDMGLDETSIKQREAELLREIEALKQENALLEKDKAQIYGRYYQLNSY